MCECPEIPFFTTMHAGTNQTPKLNTPLTHISSVPVNKRIIKFNLLSLQIKSIAIRRQNVKLMTQN